jgi:hypothetical protein
VLVLVVAALAVTRPARAGGPHLLVGATVGISTAKDPAQAKMALDLAKLAGLDAFRLSETWTRGEQQLSPTGARELDAAVSPAELDGIRVILSVYPYGSSVTPTSPADRADFAAFCASLARRYPLVHDFVIGNEPNLNRFWLPQFGPSGEDVAAPAYEQLLAASYDAVKGVRPHATVYGGALAPRGVDKPHTGRDTHSPTAFIADLGTAYRASGRRKPIMDAFAFHPYPESSSVSPSLAHPHSTSIGLADYGKLVSLLGTAFDGTAQRGSALPILYDEFGIETTIPAAKAKLYGGTEPATTKPVGEPVQASDYALAAELAFCQPTVLGLFYFHVRDELPLAGWQSGLYYADGTPKRSRDTVRWVVGRIRRGVAAHCPGLKLTPTVRVKPGTRSVTVTCSLDCRFTLDVAGERKSGTAVGGRAAVVRLAHGLKAGPHTLSVRATATVNPGPAGTARVTFRL